MCLNQALVHLPSMEKLKKGQLASSFVKKGLSINGEIKNFRMKISKSLPWLRKINIEKNIRKFFESGIYSNIRSSRIYKGSRGGRGRGYGTDLEKMSNVKHRHRQFSIKIATMLYRLADRLLLFKCYDNKKV